MKQFIHTIPLYKLSKTGKTQLFELSILINDGLYPKLYTRKGYVDGATQTDIKIFKEGKNIGRANETSPLEQAALELHSKMNKLLDKGYKKSLEELKGSKGTDALGNLKPMLAQKNINKIKFPGFTQRKYDGVRCFSFVTIKKDTGFADVRKFSRNGKLFEHLDHLDLSLIKIAMENISDGTIIIDGELYSHDMSFQKIVSSVKRAQLSNQSIGLRVYDIIGRPKENQYNRMMSLLYLRMMIRRKLIDLPHIEIAKTSIIRSMEQLKKKFALYIKEGYEGLMWRDWDSVYEFGVRSYSLIKYKEFDEDEFEILGANEATGRDEGTAVLIMRAKNGLEFRAKPMGDRELRRKYLININKYIGKMGTVKYQGLSEDGIPRFPVFKIVRDYE